MKLDRNTTTPRRGKYALIKLRECEPINDPETGQTTVPTTAVDYGLTLDSDFFVIRLRDWYAGPALREYALAAARDGQDEYAKEILHLLAMHENHPNRRRPD